MCNTLFIKLNILLGIILTVGLACKTNAQTYEDARKLAFNGDRVQARQACKVILASGFNSDVAILLGRTYAWDGKYDSTRLILNEVLAQNAQNMEALDAFTDVEYWSGNYTKAIEYCDLALKIDPSSESFMYKKAKILRSNNKSGEASAILETFIRLNPANSEARKKLSEYRLDLLKNAIKLSYTLDYFNEKFNRDPWQIASLSYRRKTKMGSILARANLASKFGDNGIQYELDAYPKISENNYGYLNYGFSQSSLFPKNRMGVEWYHNFPKSFEGSLGMRLLFFGSSDVGIYTATLGKYMGNYWISMRTFITPGTTGTSVSGFLLMRRYFSDPEDYLGLRLGYGVSPDDNRRLIDSNQELKLKTWSLRTDFNHIFKHQWVLNTGVSWGSEELQHGTFADDYTFDISISRLF